MTTRFRAPVVALLLAAAGCGKAEPTGPRSDVTEKDLQQVKELNQQRQDEWGKKKK